MFIEKLIKCVNDQNKNTLKVVEVGAGTGKLTKMLAGDFNLCIDAVEPNDKYVKKELDLLKIHKILLGIKVVEKKLLCLLIMLIG